MENVAIMIVGMMPKEELIEMLEKAISEWKNNPTDDTFENVAAIGTMVGLKTKMSEGTPDQMTKVMEDMDKFKQTSKLLNPNKS